MNVINEKIKMEFEISDKGMYILHNSQDILCIKHVSPKPGVIEKDYSMKILQHRCNVVGVDLYEV